ncbi:Ig-like domain-containing protein [Moritella sp. 28]|uniref:Ig-like domain-containing protein n=1 Tax=Moritella sp. 28 TaxID=2746232 RepID=UPI001BA65DCD|nr:Ig-like domain-containing protein [Moritella sp. 28]QUM85819.1 Ig-like domain-containing protein [Moritella sp. 28]
MIRFTSWLLLFCTLGILTACGGGGGSSAGSSEAPKPSDKKTLTSIQINIKQATTFGNIKHDIAAGLTQSYDAVGYYSDGATQVITDDVTWQVDNEALAVITNGKVEGLKSGLVMITASKGNVISPKTRLKITDAVPLSINIDLKEHEMLQGQRQDISLTATLSDDSVSRVTDGVTWITSAGIEVIQGKVVAMQAGSATLTGAYRGLSSSIDLVVKPAVLDNLKIEVKSNEINLPKGLTKKITVKGIYSNDESKDLSDEVTLVIDDESIAHLNKQGELVAIKEGNTRVHAEYLSIQSPSIPVVVTAETLTKLVITADETKIIEGLNTQLHITGEFTDGEQRPFTGKVDWFVKDMYQLDGSHILALDQGKASALVPGTVYVSAKVGNVQSKSVRISVVKAKAQKLFLTVETPNIIPNQTTSYTVMGLYDNGTRKNLTNDTLVLAERDNHTVRINHTDGTILGKIPGTTTITASRGDISSEPITITVTKAKLIKLLLTDLNEGPAGQTFKPEVYGVYELDNDEITGAENHHKVTQNVTWHSQDHNIISVENQSLVGKTPGITSIWCTLNGIESDHHQLMVTAAIPTDLDITPKNTTTNAGYSVLYQAVATYSDNSEKNVTNQVEWTSSEIERASFIDNTLHAKDSGFVIISATFGKLKKSTSLKIGQAKLKTIKLDELQDGFALGQKYQLSGIGTDSLGKAIALNAKNFNWHSADNSIVTFTALPGEIKAISEGSTEVTVTDKSDSSITFSMTIQVGPKALREILIDATSFGLIYGTDMKLSATGIYTDGTSNDISEKVEWSSSSEVITIDQDGLALARQQDDTASSSTDISAKLGDIDTTKKFTVNNINVIYRKPNVVSFITNSSNVLFSLTPSKEILRMMDYNTLNEADRVRLRPDHVIYEGQGQHPQFKHFNSNDGSATQFCEGLSNARFNDRHNWKLASVKELKMLRTMSLFDETLIDSDYFTNATDTNTMVDLDRKNDNPVKMNLPYDTQGYVSCVSID